MKGESLEIGIVYLGVASGITVCDAVGAFQCAAIEQLFPAIYSNCLCRHRRRIPFGKRLLNQSRGHHSLYPFDKHNSSRASFEQQVC